MQKSRLNSTLAIAAIMSAAGHAVVHTGRMTSNRSNLVETDKPYVPPKTNKMVTSPRSEIDAWNAAVEQRKWHKQMNRRK